jgi:Leucine-rich repeat (LRR) protein
MKKIFIILYIFFYYKSGAQIVNIPDANFKALLVNSSTTNGTAYDCAINSYYKIDYNDDGEIEANEALAVCQLNLINASIADLTGIEVFTNLKRLVCVNNNLTNVNVSQLVQMEILNLYQNQLMSLDVSNLPNLRQLECRYNQITSLNFANNPLLQNVFCSNNQLTSLDFSANPLFNQLDCYNNPNLSSVNIQNGATQLLGTQTYYNQCWTGLPNLTTICADTNELVALQNYLTSCGTDISGINFHGNCALGNEEFDQSELVISPNPTTGFVTIDNIGNYKNVMVYSVLGQELMRFLVPRNDKNAIIDLSDYSNGVYFIILTDDNKNKQIVKLIKR